MKLPPHKSDALAPARIKNGEDWFSAWQLEQRLHALEPLHTSTYAAARSNLPTKRERTEIAEGEIRLLAPCDGVLRPVYVYLLSVGPGHAVVIPFSRFCSPASPDEYQWPGRAPAISVLCFWNTRRVTTETLNGSWVVAECAEAEHARISRIWQHMAQSGQIPEGNRDQTGPPLVFPDDPRWEYRDEESERMDRALGLWRVENDADEGPGLYVMEGGFTQEHRLAAEARTGYTGCLARYVATDTGETLECHKDETGALQWTLRDTTGTITQPEKSWQLRNERGETISWHNQQPHSAEPAFPETLKLNKNNLETVHFHKLKTK